MRAKDPFAVGVALAGPQEVPAHDEALQDQLALVNPQVVSSEVEVLKPHSHEAPCRKVIFVTASVFMGYAALVTMQHRLKSCANVN